MGKLTENKILNIPNAISLIRIFIIIPLAGYFYIKGDKTLATLMGIIFIFADVLDGYIARKFKQITNFGIYLDVIGDTLFITVVAFTFLYLDYLTWPLIALITAHRFTRLFLTLFIGMYAHSFYLPLYIKFFTAFIPLTYALSIPFLYGFLDMKEVHDLTFLIIGGSYVVLVAGVIFAIKNLKKGKLRMMEVEKLKVSEYVNKNLQKNIKEESTLANITTIVRTIAVIAGLILLKDNPIFLATLIVLAIILDAADGYLARKYRGSRLGAFVDILGDRLVETMILFTYAHWGLVSFIFPIAFLTRGISTDFIRMLNAIYPQDKYSHPLKLGHADNRMMRAVSAISKILAFTTILFFPKLGFWMMVVALTVNLYRSIPAIFNQRSAFLLKTFFKSIKKKVINL